MKKLLFYIVFCLCASFAFTQNKEINYKLSVQGSYSFVWAHDKKLNNLAGSNATGFSIDLNRYRTDLFTHKYWRKNFVSGFNFSYYNFSFDTLGQCFSLGYFIEPNLINNKNFAISLRALGGFNYVTNPYNKDNNLGNIAYSSYINGHLALGLRVRYNLNKNYSINAIAQYNHFSNGSTKHPNFGLNFPGFNVGVERKIGSVQKPLKETLQEEKYRLDAFGYFCNKSHPHFKENRYWVFGGGVTLSRKIGLINALTLSTELIADYSLKDVLIINGDGDRKIARVGLMIGHEFIFNRMIFSQQFGSYVFNDIPYFDRFYHRFGINYKLKKNIMVGTNLHSNAQKAQFLELRLTYSFYK